MKVDTDKIRELFDRETPYRISKDTGLTLSVVQRLVNGERKLESASIRVGAILTEYAKDVVKQEG